ncbi:copia-type polyprotein, partial [Trifolium medium]|nr:copia-type polyprotein [Trifolium medium]
MVYKLKKALYGLKQAPRAWYSKIDSYFAAENFEKCPYEHTLFVKYGVKNEILVVSLYVDDLIYTGNDQGLMDEFKSSMKKKFAMTDLGKMRYFLGVEVNQICSLIVPGCKLVKNENSEATDATTYKQMVGCLMYLLASRPDLAYS